MKRKTINYKVQARLASLRELQSATGEELRRRRTLLPSVLDGMFMRKLRLIG